MKFIHRLFRTKAFLMTLVGVCIGMLIWQNEVWAAPGSITADNAAKSLAQILSLVVNLVTFFIMLMINYMGDLFGVDMITGDTPMSVIRPMWVVIRNITNIIFVGILLFLVFSNLFGISNWSVKEKLPKVIIALVAINFSLVGFRVILDVVNVGTVSILAIPQDIMREKGVGSVQDIMLAGYNSDGEPCPKLIQNTSGTKWNIGDGGVADITDASGAQKYPYPFTGEEECAPFYARMNNHLCDNTFSRGDAETDDSCLFYIDPLKLNKPHANSMASHNLMTAFAVYFFRIEQLPALAGQIQSWDGVVMNVLFSTIMALAIIVSLFAVFVVLLVRVVFLWIAMVFSPFLLAAAILGIGGGGGDLSSKFVTYLIIPIKVAAVFAVTYIMMSAMVEFSTSNMQNEYLVMGPSLSLFGMGISGLLWQIATIGIFWKAAFWAVKDTEAQWVIDGIKGGAETLAGVAGRWATIDRPILPGKDGKPNKLSVGSFARTPNLVKGAYDTMRSKNESNLKEFLGIETSAAEKALKEFALKNHTAATVMQNMIDVMKKMGPDQWRQSPTAMHDTFRSQLKEANPNINLNDPSVQTFLNRIKSGGMTYESAAQALQGINANASTLGITPVSTPITRVTLGANAVYNGGVWGTHTNISDLATAIQTKVDGGYSTLFSDYSGVNTGLGITDAKDQLKAELGASYATYLQ
jgi:hypothetical protein